MRQINADTTIQEDESVWLRMLPKRRETCRISSHHSFVKLERSRCTNMDRVRGDGGGIQAERYGGDDSTGDMNVEGIGVSSSAGAGRSARHVIETRSKGSTPCC